MYLIVLSLSYEMCFVLEDLVLIQNALLAFLWNLLFVSAMIGWVVV